MNMPFYHLEVDELESVLVLQNCYNMWMNTFAMEGKLRRHFALRAEKKKTSRAKSASCLTCIVFFTPYHT